MKLRKGAITNDHSNGSTSPSRLLTNVTITEKLKNPKFSQQKLRYSPETELINNFDKSHNSVLIAKIQHFVSITNINNESQIYWCNGFTKNIFQELFQTWNPFHNVMALWSHHARIWSSFHLRNKNENKNCLWASSKRKLKQTSLKFSNVQNH